MNDYDNEVTTHSLQHSRITGVHVNTYFNHYREKLLYSGLHREWEIYVSDGLTIEDGHIYFAKKLEIAKAYDELYSLFTHMLDNFESMAADISKIATDHLTAEYNADNHRLEADIEADVDGKKIQVQIVFFREKLNTNEVACEVVVIFGEENIKNRVRVINVVTPVTVQ